MTEANHSDLREHQDFWIAICEKYVLIMIAYARKLVNGREYDAEDLVQETKYRALAASKDPATIKKTPLAYLKGIMRNAWIDKWKSENSANMESIEYPPGSAKQKQIAVEPIFAQLLECTEAKEKMLPQMGPLTPREATLLKLYLLKKKCGEIADIMGEDVRIIQTDLNRIRNKVNYRLKSKKKTSPNQP
jgi:RNA polymerase sigma factor (sigma-70 family)